MPAPAITRPNQRYRSPRRRRTRARTRPRTQSARRAHPAVLLISCTNLLLPPPRTFTWTTWRPAPRPPRPRIPCPRTPTPSNRSSAASWPSALGLAVPVPPAGSPTSTSTWHPPPTKRPTTRPRSVSIRSGSTRRSCARPCGASTCWSERRTVSCCWIAPARER